MVWTAPKTEIRELRGTTQFVQTQTQPSLASFEAICKRFDPGPSATQFVFVRAGDGSRGLVPAEIIPCQKLVFKDLFGADPLGGDEILQSIKFEASLHQREAGSYHLVGWHKPEVDDDGLVINQACVYEFAIVIQALPPDKLDAERERAQKKVEAELAAAAAKPA